MASLKLLNILALAIAVTSVYSKPYADEITPYNDEIFMIGERQHNDQLVYQEHLSIPASYVGLKVVHEQTFSATKGNVITQVLAINQVKDGTGASVVIVGGGPGQEYVRLKFKSQRFHGIYYTVQLYARPK